MRFNGNTRLNLGGGLGGRILVQQPDQRGDPTNADITVTVPVRLGIEHFFEDWLSVEIATKTELINIETYSGEFQQVSLGFDSTNFSGLLFFYLD